MTSTHFQATADKNYTLCVEYKPVSDLFHYSSNARTHSKHQIRQIAESIRQFGFTNPILVDSEVQ